MNTRRWALAVGGFALLLVVGVATYSLRRIYHFATVEPGVLYRAGQLDASELERVRASTGIRTIVDLCVEKRDWPAAVEEREFAAEHGLRYVHLPLTTDIRETEEFARRFLEVLDDPGSHPVLVHCWRGVKRTGLMVAIYRMEYQHISNEQAVAELPAFGRDLEDFVDGEPEFIESYVPRYRREDRPSGEENGTP